MSSPLSSASSMWLIIGLWRRSPLASLRTSCTGHDVLNVKAATTTALCPTTRDIVGVWSYVWSLHQRSAGDGPDQILRPYGHRHYLLLARSHVPHRADAARELVLAEYGG